MTEKPDTYLTIASASQGLYKDKGSRFLAFAFPVESEQETEAFLIDIRKKYHDARHHCYAWALGPERQGMRVNDDGEPSGTAGKPIYGQILSAGITNVLIVVVRYFGGIKLGVRGLIDAYKGAAADALQEAEIVERIIMARYRIRFSYEQMNEVMKVMKQYGLEQEKHQFDTICSMEFLVRLSIEQEVCDALGGCVSLMEKVNQ